ncbi:hypothetical protein D3C73_941690 [compost metagenome]
MHRIEAAEQGAPHGHHADEIIENRTQLFFAARGTQPLAVAFAGAGAHLQRGAHQQAGHVGLGRATVDLVAGDLAQARHRRVHLEGRFLLGDREYRTQVLR